VSIANTISAVLVAGTGFMGSSIAYLLASKTSAEVYLYDKDTNALLKAEHAIAKIGEDSLQGGFLTKDELNSSKSRLHTLNNLEELPHCNLVIEAIVEELDTKKELFRILDNKCRESTILASNTSSLSITSLAAATSRSDRFIGMHFFAPAHKMKLLELIPGLGTSESTLKFVSELGKQLGKTVITSKDAPGFITTRLGMVLLNEAAFALMEGLSSAEEIDQGMQLGYNHPMGPLALADFIGLDVCLNIMEAMHKNFGDPKYRPCLLLKQLVSAGYLGKKSGRGFYKYS
jgi:3-hydroxybutyryl-CoA dehydrogenase